MSEPASTIPPKLSALAKSLFNRLWKPLAPFIMDNRTVYLVPDGPLQSLPFGVLVTEEPEGEITDIEDYREVPWLGLLLRSGV